MNQKYLAANNQIKRDLATSCSAAHLEKKSGRTTFLKMV